MSMLDMKPSEKAFVNEKGYKFCPVAGLADIFNREHEKEGFKVFLVFDKDDKPVEYLLYRNKVPIYASPKYEDVAYQIDKIKLKVRTCG